MQKMIEAAAVAGADYVKTQSIRAEFLSHRPRFDKGVVENGITKVIKRPYLKEYERLCLLDINMDDHRWFIKQCHDMGVKAMTTVFTRGVVDELAEMDWDAIKVASYDCASFPLLRDLKKKFGKECRGGCRLSFIKDTSEGGYSRRPYPKLAPSGAGRGGGRRCNTPDRHVSEPLVALVHGTQLFLHVGHSIL